MSVSSLSQRTVVPLVAAIAAASIAGTGAWMLRDREANRDLAGATSLAAVAAKIAEVDLATKLILAKLDTVSEKLVDARKEVDELRTAAAPRSEVLATWRAFAAMNPTVTPPPGIK